MLGDICEKLPGGDIDVVSDALGMDSRIGRKYLTGGFGFGGPCFPRDNLALSFIGESLGANCAVPRANDAFNRSISERAVAKLHGIVEKGQNIAVLGLAYKPQSHVIEESPGIFLCRTLADSGYRVIGYDPLAGEPARATLGDRALIVDDINDCLRDAQVVIITTPDPQFAALSADAILGRKRSVTVVDFWRVAAARLGSAPNIRYFPMGRCTDDAAAGEALQKIWTGTA
jgi:UDPglucose 6-dehydrogenase